jgi:hypothetical protein
MIESYPGKVQEVKGLPPLTENDWFNLIQTHKETWDDLDEEELSRLSRDIPDFKSYPRARVASVLEPLKVRLITAMSSVHTIAAKPLQISLWKYLRQIPPFSLIGESISEIPIQALFDRHKRLFGNEDDPPIVSGDYQAATDRLNINVTKIIQDEINRCIDPSDRFLIKSFNSILREQILFYPSWSKIPPAKQENGQLMGSILSFCVLCIANLFTYVESLTPELQHRFYVKCDLSPAQLPVLVNGDDILFRAHPDQYDRWLKSTSSVGFQLSVGKNFVHQKFFTVNSVPIAFLKDEDRYVDLLPNVPLPGRDKLYSPVPWYLIDPRRLYNFVHFRTDRFEIYGYINVGLLTGQSKLTGSDSTRSTPLSGWYAKSVVPACNPSFAHKRFIFYHRSEIYRQTKYGSKTLNIFAHPYLGGLGFPVPQGVTPRYSAQQKRLAFFLKEKALKTYNGQASEYPLSPILVLECVREVGPPVIIGHRRNIVEVAMYPLGTPLAKNLNPFLDDTTIYPRPLSLDYPTMKPGVPACRLTNPQLDKLMGESTVYFDSDSPALPEEEMSSFPFIPVRVNREIILKDGSISTDQSFWFPESIQDTVLDEPTPLEDYFEIPLDYDLSEQDLYQLVPPVSLETRELWEYPVLPIALREELLRGGPPRLRPTPPFLLNSSASMAPVFSYLNKPYNRADKERMRIAKNQGGQVVLSGRLDLTKLNQ